MRACKRAALLGALATVALLVLAGPAEANSPWWHITSTSRPSYLPPNVGETGQVVVTVANLGDATTANGEATPVVIEDTLPEHLKTLSIEAVAGGPGPLERGGVNCKKSNLTCTFGTHKNSEGEVIIETLTPYDQIEIRIGVETLAGAQSGEENQVNVSGGGAPPASLSRPLRIGPGPVPFGVDDYELSAEEEGGAATTQAGAHPFQLTTTVDLNQLAATITKTEKGRIIYDARPAAIVKDIGFHWPAGLLGDPSPFPTCTLAQFLTTINPEGTAGELVNACPPKSAVGVVVVTVDGGGTPAGGDPLFHTATLPLPIFALEPAFGEPARFGFYVGGANTPVIIDPAVRSANGEDYGVDVGVSNTIQVVSLLASKATVWGVPGDPRHDSSRGYACLLEDRGLTVETIPSCKPSEEAHPPALLTMPTACSGEALPTTVQADSWLEPQNPISPLSADPPMTTLDSCNKPGAVFEPRIKAEPTSNAATTGTGLAFDLDFPNNGLVDSGSEAAESVLKKAVVTLPEGFTTNPSVAEGLKACSQAEYESATVKAGTGCLPESKVGEVEVESPLVEGKKVTGGIFVAKQGENPYHNLLTLYLIARNEELGVLVRQALKVEADKTTGQLRTTVDNIPQLPFSHFHLQFRSGQRSPLITPPACGTYTVTADLFPWADPSRGVEDESSFKIEAGPEGQPCPSGGLPPFHPELLAGTINNAAGTFSPFDTKITRRDSEQEITNFSIKLPPGVIGRLAGVSFCSDQAIAAAKAREHEGGGTEEQASPSCPASSEVGRSLAGSGVGNVLAYAPGKLYLAGPYHGSNLSLVSITAAKVGPFDLGTVVVRFALRVNPETAEVFVDATGSDPIPHIVDGIPVHLKDIRAYVDRPQFVLNPTNCTPTSTASTVLGAGLDFSSEADNNPVTVTSRFQAADCAALPFGPQLSFRLLGSPKHGALPALRTTLKMNGIGEAGVGHAEVILPHSEFIENAHFNTTCKRGEFNSGPGNGANCPAGSIYGHARAVTPLLEEPLEGPVMLRANPERNLPDVVAALHNKEVDFDLVGNVDSVNGRLRTTFANAPDAPVTSFELELDGKSKGLFINSAEPNLCAAPHYAVVNFTGQNGKVHDLKVLVQAKCPKARHHKRHHKRGHK